MGEMTILQPGEIEIYDIVEEINREHELCIGSMRNTLEHAIRVGELLNEQKEKVPQGEWYIWVRMNCSFAERQAQYYMRIARYANSTSLLENETSVMSAIRILTSPDKKPKALPEQEQELAISFSWFNDERITDVYDAMKKMIATITLLKSAKQDPGAAYQILQQWDNGLNKLIEKIRE